MRKLFFFAYAKTKTQISCAVTAQLISAFVFAKRVVQSLFYLNPKFQASGHLLWLYSPVCVGPGWKPRRPVFSERGSNCLLLFQKNCIKAGKLVISGTMIGGCKISVQRRHKTESFGNAVQEKTDHYTGMSKVK